MKKIFNIKWSKIALFVILGAVGGYSYYYFIGCTTNACPITSNPYISSGYGMMIGLLLSLDTRKKEKKSETQKGD
jgi:hypothetical protein